MPRRWANGRERKRGGKQKGGGVCGGMGEKKSEGEGVGFGSHNFFLCFSTISSNFVIILTIFLFVNYNGISWRIIPHVIRLLDDTPVV